MNRRTSVFLVVAGSLFLLHGDVTPRGGAQAKKDAGPTIAADNRITWQGWQFQWAIHPRNGLVLQDVSFSGRSVLKYAGLAEVFVPYNRGQPRPTDFGDGIATRMVELFPGKDCVPGALACHAFNKEGKEQDERYVMMHEEGLGLSYLGNLGRAQGKMLILWCAYNLDGYYYICRWRFRDDGCLMPDVGMTGPLQFVDKGEPSAYGSIVGKEKTFAPSHVHNLYFCLDFDIDGADDNVVEEFNCAPDKAGGLTAKHSWTRLTTEAGRSMSAGHFRSWRVVNPSSLNAHGLPRSYELIPGGNGLYRGATQERFAQADFWVTRHHAKEHPNDDRALDVALPSYLNGEDVGGRNVVVWYAVHVHHCPRTEDWPGMPVEWVGFMLKPRDFLDASPVEPK